jgi:hypothetical protein
MSAPTRTNSPFTRSASVKARLRKPVRFSGRNTWIVLRVALVAVLGASAIGCRSTKPPASQRVEAPAKKPGEQKAALLKIAEQWLPDEKTDFGSVGCFTPTNTPPTVYAVSFTTKKPLGEVWNLLASKCGIAEKYEEPHLYMLSGQSKCGDYALVERMEGLLRADTIFTLRTTGHTISATLKPGTGRWPTEGTVVIVLDRAYPGVTIRRPLHHGRHCFRPNNHHCKRCFQVVWIVEQHWLKRRMYSPSMGTPAALYGIMAGQKWVSAFVYAGLAGILKWWVGRDLNPRPTA